MDSLTMTVRSISPTYKTATMALLQLAFQHTSGGRTAAQLLLSAYDGSNWQLDVTDLCHLDRINLKHALVFMECRATLLKEPHDVIDDGNEVFARLQKFWRKLHINNRWKRPCTECFGTGEVFKFPDRELDDTLTPCQCCDGIGQLAEISHY